MIGALTNGFAEGFDAEDLQETKALLEALGGLLRTPKCVRKSV
jgi:hypothetical protein